MSKPTRVKPTRSTRPTDYEVDESRRYEQPIDTNCVRCGEPVSPAKTGGYLHNKTGSYGCKW